MSASAALNAIGTMLQSRGEGIADGCDSPDNESNFESASHYLGRNLASDDMDEIDQDDVDEIPVWVRGESRWIAGVTEHTTAADLVEALVLDDRSLYEAPTCSSTDLPPTTVLQQFVITERWRQMEQILEPKTKVLKIWKAWGEAQCEVRLRLRKIDRNGPMQSSTPAAAASHNKKFSSSAVVDEEVPDDGQLMYDSGRESPTGSAIVRRRRHRASKSTAAWLTQAQTVHPKSSKTTIEKLMSLILEQGETIQQQLSKLRDREIQISQLEEQKHRVREQEHGKNYLLETYLNGLHEAEEKDLTTINSDSGVNTEDTQSPNGGTSPTMVCESEEKIIPSISSNTKKSNFPTMFEYTERENELLRDHENTKSFKLKLAPKEKAKRQQQPVDGEEEEVSERERREIEDKIGVLEKIYVINKHLQKEEELLVRLNAKIKRYESDNPNLKEDEILTTLHRLNSEIEQRNREIEITNREIELSDELLNKKSAFLNELGTELGKTFEEEAALMGDTQNPNNHSDHNNGDETNYFNVNPENIYNISKILLKYSDDGIESPETERDHRINIAACHRPAINKTDTNKRIIIEGHAVETRSFSPRRMVTTQVQIHKQPPPLPGTTNGTGEHIDYPSQPTGNNYPRCDPVTNLPNLYTSSSAYPVITTGGTDGAVSASNVSDFTPGDLIAASMDLLGHEEPSAVICQYTSTRNHTAHARSAAPQPGINNKVVSINSARNISATLMDNKKLAHKSLILTSKAYEGLTPPVTGAPLFEANHPQQQSPQCAQTDMTQLGTLV